MAKHKRGGKKVGGAPKKPPLTHFLCIPLITADSKPQLEASLRMFKDDVVHNYIPGPATETEEPLARGPKEEVESASGSGSSDDEALKPQTERSDVVPKPVPAPLVAEKAVRPVGAIHLTLGVMSLDADKLKGAVQLLNNIDLVGLLKHPEQATPAKAITENNRPAQEGDIWTGETTSAPASLTRPMLPLDVSGKPEALMVSLKSLESMHPAHKTSILYTAPKDPSGRLYPFADALRRQFTEAGFLLEDKRPLKLHATLVNTIYAKGRKRHQRPNKNVKPSDQPEAQEKNQVEGGEVAIEGPATEDKKEDEQATKRKRMLMKIDLKATDQIRKHPLGSTRKASSPSTAIMSGQRMWFWTVLRSVRWALERL
ncbi:hypothetical protein H2203_005734 [Taxawa tesnikishii (nom. ined.)]|nr:hypothetical protein H2203_005734 [Dothideales sp. JES 119]